LKSRIAAATLGLLLSAAGTSALVLVIDKGRHTGAKPGQILRGAGYEPAAARQSP
jgi:hypothetical protein